MPALSVDQILMSCLSGSVVLLAAVIRFSMSGILERIDKLENSFQTFSEKVMVLGFSDKAFSEKVEKIEYEFRLIKERLDTNETDLALLKHTQERCRSCTPRN